MNRNFQQSMREELILWKETYHCTLELPIEKMDIEKLNQAIGPLPSDLVEFYCITNGLTCDYFKIFPIEDPKNIKKTWDGIKRNNEIETTKFLQSNAELLQKFLVFAEIGAEKCAVYNKNDFTIWYEDAGKLNQTDLSLREFINLMLLEVYSL